ncbi:hypothetical protein CYY_006315 [Polysphondylium violaceum]|uniref:alpha-L-fucosidase n=1 Tax=Polysphondylium violaceum TaxID=133409 RepID=A0A8J4PSD4_9MYCE|nr:hypothetical protein CYY_006315 [Polysphondylium violaceum]
MKLKNTTLIFIIFSFIGLSFQNKQQIYTPTWDSLNARPLPAWYDQVKFGIFIHWGVYSVPAYAKDGYYAEWYWNYLENPSSDGGAVKDYHTTNFGANFSYHEFAPMFNARLFNPDHWASMIEKSGAKYVVLTSKHHEGFTLWDSPQSWGWNSVDVGPQLDLVGALTKSIKSIPGMHMGLYHSLYEWFNPLYLIDKASGSPPTSNQYIQDILMPQLKDIVNKYEPDVVWSDGDWEQSSDYWGSKEFLAWLYTNSTVKDSVVVNDRWGSECRNIDGGYWTGSDQWNPETLIPHKWENCYTMGFSYGYDENEDISYYQNTTYILQQLVSTVSCGGNMLLDIAPNAEGVIPINMQERLEEIGNWLNINGESIYSTVPWRVQNDSTSKNIWYTTNTSDPTSAKAVYAISLEWPESNYLDLNSPIPTAQTSIQLLGYPKRSNSPSHYLDFSTKHKGNNAPIPGLTIHLPLLGPQDYPPYDIYVFKLLNVE